MRRRWLATLGGGAALLLGALLILDRVFPPDLSRYERASVVVTDRDGGILRAFETAEGAWRLPTTAEDVDPRYLALLRAYEDQRFQEHVGVDPLAVARAAWQWASSGHIVSGASTLTMQAARLLEPQPRSLGAKLRQMARAVQLEARLSKERILSIYLTLAPFGGNLEGVRAASLAYFGKEPRRLSLGEVALLVALPQSPERLRPDRHPEAALAARAKVLRRLWEHGVLSETEVADALSEPLPATRLAFPFLAPHLAQYLAAKAAPGSTIATPIDRGLQSSLEALAKREALRFDDAGDLAIVVVENRAHAVRAYLGSSDFFGPHGQIDLARAQRSPGSALKPFIYGFAFDDRVTHPTSLIDDEPMRFGDYIPRNFDRQFQGTVSVREALQQSLNVPAVALLDRVGAVRFVGDLRAAGAGLSFRRLVGTPSLPVALGGLGISLADLTMLYASFPNGGEVTALRLTENPAPKPVRLMGSAAAWYVTDILRGSPLPEGYATGPRPAARPRHRLQDRHLLWFPRCLGDRVFARLHRGRLGRARRRLAAPRALWPQHRDAHPAQDLRSAAARSDRLRRGARRSPERQHQRRVAAGFAALCTRPPGAYSSRRRHAAAHSVSAGWRGRGMARRGW